MHDDALLRLEHVAIGPRALSYLESLISKLHFEAKTPIFALVITVTMIIPLRLEYIFLKNVRGAR